MRARSRLTAVRRGAAPRRGCSGGRSQSSRRSRTRGGRDSRLASLDETSCFCDHDSALALIRSSSTRRGPGSEMRHRTPSRASIFGNRSEPAQKLPLGWRREGSIRTRTPFRSPSAMRFRCGTEVSVRARSRRRRVQRDERMMFTRLTAAVSVVPAYMRRRAARNESCVGSRRAAGPSALPSGIRSAMGHGGSSDAAGGLPTRGSLAPITIRTHRLARAVRQFGRASNSSVGDSRLQFSNA